MVLPSSQAIYGIVLMFILQQKIDPDTGFTVNLAAGLFGIGLLAGIALLIGGVYQGMCCASAINASTQILPKIAARCSNKRIPLAKQSKE